MASAKYGTLVSRISTIEANLLSSISPTITAYTIKDEDMVRSYCLLCHAEIEAYLETYTLEIVKDAFDSWKLDKTIISPIIFHLTFHHCKELTKNELPYSITHLAYSELCKKINGNNGLKDDNVKSFLKPIGFEMDPVLLIELTGFGKIRGDIAHQSFQTQQPLDAATQKSRINGIVSNLEIFDTDLKTYESTGDWKNKPVNIMWTSYSFWQRLRYLFTGK
jgi:hypothetical protein